MFAIWNTRTQLRHEERVETATGKALQKLKDEAGEQ